MMKRYVLGIDQGTSGVAAALFDENWQQVSLGYREIRQIYPQDGWVEHDATDVWEAVCRAVSIALQNADASPTDVVAVGLDHEGESAMLWDAASGKPIANTIVWQDRRTAADAEAVTAKHGKLIRERTGLQVDSYFSALKWRWLLDNVPAASALLAEGRLLAGNMDAWLAWKMTGGRLHATDVSTASRTMLMNLQSGTWDRDVLGALDIPLSILPVIQDSASAFGETDPDAFCGIRAPLTALLNDQQAALYGQACFDSGDVKTSYGTGCFMLMNTGDTPIVSKEGLVTTVGWRINGTTTYALDGGIYIAGAATKWLRDGLGIISSADETEHMAQRVGSNGGVYFVPAFSGLAAPHWDSYARGTMLGITAATTQEHIVRATLESIAYQVCDLLQLMQQESGLIIPSLRCDGGGTKNAFLMQFQADMLGIPLYLPSITETTVLGTAFMAAIGAGLCRDQDELRGHWQMKRCFEPHMSRDERESLLHTWHRAVERSRRWIEP